MKLSHYLFKYTRKYSLIILGSIIFSLIFSLLTAVFLGLIQPLFDRVIFFTTKANPSQIQYKSKAVIWLLNYVNSYLNFSNPLMGLTQIGIVIFWVTLIKGIFYFLQYYLSSMSGQLTVRDIRQDLYKHLWTLSLDYFSQEHTGNLLSHFSYDLISLEQAISKGTRDVFINTFQIILSIIILFGLDWKLTLVVFFCIPFIFLPVVKLGNNMRLFTRKLNNKMADLNVVLQETITGIRIVRAFNMEEKEINRFKKENDDYLEFIKKIARIKSVDVPIIETLFTFIAVGILGYGGLRILEGYLTSGEFFMYFGTLLYITPRFGVLGRVYGIYQAGMASMEKVASILEVKPFITEKENLLEHIIEKEIVYRDVNFGYGSGNLVLKNINFTIKKGEMVAIVGPSGAGKTTMVDLLARFYNNSSGKIEIDGIDIQNISIRSLRGQIGIVTQDTFLFHDTIENNIRYGRPEASLDEIEQAAKKAYALEFIKKMPNGFQGIAGERGTQLSGGQRQRISIARVILKNPPILILDEATSSLDSESEHEVQKALDSLFEGRTTIVIAHRLSTIRHADKIILLDKNTIQDIGLHDELMQRSTLYRELYELQFIK